MDIWRGETFGELWRTACTGPKRTESVDMMTKKINTLLIEMNISKKELARRLNTSPSNLSGKLKRDNFTEKELRQIAQALNCDYDGIFTFKDSGKQL